MEEKQFIETSGNIHIYRILKPIPEGTWQVGDKVHNSTLYHAGHNIEKLIKYGYIKNIDEPYDWQKELVGKNEHSVFVKCGQCGHWGCNFPLDNKCAHCGYAKGITYYDAQTIDVLINKLKSQNCPQPGPVWVKASEQKPDHFKVDFKDKHGNEFKGNYSKETGQYYAYGFTQAINDVAYWRKYDESPAEIPVADNARYELSLALRDLIKLTKHIGCSITNYHQFEQRVEAAEAMLNKHSKVTDVLRAEQPGREKSDASEFLEWAYKNRWFNKEGDFWCYTFEQGTRVSDAIYKKNYMKKTYQLYQLFKEQKKA